MANLKFGVARENFTREYICGIDVLNRINHYQGQLFISTDGQLAKTLDDVTVQMVRMKRGILALLAKQLEEECTRNAVFAKEYEVITDEAFCPDNLSWLSVMSRYPIAWYDTFDEALSYYLSVPKHFTVASAHAVKKQ